MFDFVHNNKKLVQIIMALITLPFAIWGVGSYNRSRSLGAEVVAVVNGDKITRQELGNALQQQEQRMRQQLGSNFDAKMLDNPQMQRAVVDGLVTRHLLVDRAKNANLSVTDEQVAAVIGGIRDFQDGGKFDKTRYETVLRENNLSPLMFEARVREELLGQQIQGVYAQNGFAPIASADQVARLSEQQRTIHVASISFQSYIKQAKVDEAELKKYYEQNKGAFQIQEQARVAYLTLSEDDLMARAEVGKDDIRKYYDEHQSEFGTPEERQAAHILITISPNATQVEQDAARNKAEQLLQQVRKNPSMFAELARQNSQDPGSASNGGDLGFFGRGMMVKPFEDAAFGLKVGEISDLVKSDFGYHIIKLIAIKPSRVLPFDEAREKIGSKLRQQKAAEMFAEMADKFSNTVYEQSDSLKPAAELIGKKIEQSGWLTKGKPAGVPWTGKMLDAIFNDEIVRNKRNTAAIEVSDNELVAARIMDYKPASERSFADVKDEIRQKLLKQHAMELAIKDGKTILEQLQHGSGKPELKWGAAQDVTRLQRGSLSFDQAQQVFQWSAAKLPGYVGAEDGQNGFAIIRIDSIKDIGTIDDAKRSRYSQQLRQLTGDALFQAYLADAKQHADIEINMPVNAANDQ